MPANKSFSIIYNVQKIILLIFYSISMISLFIPLARWINRISPENPFPLVLVFILFIVISVVLGTFIYVISYIPFNLSAAFDPIKNDIASGKISTKEEFGKRITVFMTDFFDFSFLDIEFALFLREDISPVTSHDDPDILTAIINSDILKISKESKEIRSTGVIRINKRSCHLYVLPVWFGEQWLGCIGLLSSKRINGFFQKFLMEFENNFIDDQLLHII